MTEFISVEQDERVTVMTINRPDKKNAITQAMYGKMADTIAAYEQDDVSRALVITGSGDMFTAGNDMMDFATGEGTEIPPVARFLHGIQACSKPLIAAVNGRAIGVGLTMLLHCDLVFAADTASFSAPFASLALVPEAASSMLLPEIVGVPVANDIFLTGRVLTAEEARVFGLISRVFGPDELLPKAMEIAHQIAASAPNAVRHCKALVRHDRDTVAAHLAKEGQIFFDQVKSSEFSEIIAAKMQNRAPNFS